MKATERFKAIIKNYLDARAEEDELFAQSYNKETKNIDECVSYIFTEVQKSGCNGFADEEIFGMAVHYYDEDNIKVEKTSIDRVVVNHTIDLTDKEKAIIREKAKKDFYQAELDKCKAINQPKKKVEVKDEQQLSLFDL